jgi:glycosyltransferase involved in cell wall biosynthesis
VVASSAHLGAETARYAGLAPERVQVLHWGVDLDQFHPANGPCDRPVIGFLKNLQEVYGPDVLLDCLPELLWALPEVRVLMIGGGRLEAWLKQRAEHLGVQHAIDWIGYVDYSAIPDYLSRMAVTVMPSRREALGMAAIESQAMGVPVVASRVGGIPECVLDGTTGVLVPPDDPQALGRALRTVLTDSALRHRLARNGRGHVAAKFNWRTTLQKMIAIYESVVEKRGA